MNLKGRLTVLSFLQFFVWGAWLITIATYFFSNNMGRLRGTFTASPPSAFL